MVREAKQRIKANRCAPVEVEVEAAPVETRPVMPDDCNKGAPRPVTPTVAAWFKLSEEKQEAYNDAIELWNEANPDPVYFAAQAAIKEAGEPEWHSLEEGWDAYQVRLDKWEAEHADIVAAFKAAEAAWTERDRPWQAEEAAREKAAFAAKDAKRIKREAKDPEGYKAASLEEAQADEIDNSGEEEDAKQDAREGGERWGDVKDDWRENWINDNWTPELEAAWLVEFEDKWLADHGQAFPGHGKAEPKLEPVKAEAKPVEAAAPVVEAKPVKVEPVSVTVREATLAVHGGNGFDAGFSPYGPRIAFHRSARSKQPTVAFWSLERAERDRLLRASPASWPCSRPRRARKTT